MIDKYANKLQIGDRVQFLASKQTAWRLGTVRDIEDDHAKVDDGDPANNDCRVNGARLMAFVPSHRISKDISPHNNYTTAEYGLLSEMNANLQDRVRKLEEELAHRKAVLTIPEVYTGVVSDAVATELEDAKARIVELMRELQEARQR
jgi:hypothetical protein